MTSTVRRTHRRALLTRIFDYLLRRRNDEDDDLVFLSRKEVHQLLEQRARESFGMSADEFIAAADRGEMRESPLAQHLLLIAGERPR